MSSRINKAERRYQIEFFTAMALYIAVLIGAKLLAKGMEPGWQLTALALAPQVPIAFACIAFLRYFFSADERERRLIADAAAISLLVGIFVAITLGALASFEIFSADWDIIWAGPFLIAVWGVTRCVLQAVK